MARLLLVAGLGALSGKPLYPSRPAQVEERGVVYWRAQRPLRWRDFQARVCPVQTHATERALGACVTTGIALLPCADARGRGTFQVASYLNPSRSWVRDSSSFTNPLMLTHEQVHFDINELYARRIRVLVADYYRTGRYPFGVELHERVAELLLAKTTCNNRFDTEVYADPIGGSVTRWQATVRQQLQELAAYGADACACR
jgi:hypothetical protein